MLGKYHDINFLSICAISCYLPAHNSFFALCFPQLNVPFISFLTLRTKPVFYSHYDMEEVAGVAAYTQARHRDSEIELNIAKKGARVGGWNVMCGGEQLVRVNVCNESCFL